MIQSFADAVTQALFESGRHRKFPAEVAERAFLKLRRLHAAETIEALRVPPSNRLEKLKGDRAGFWSIRINDQWRICFRWEEGHAHHVEIVDYH
jgi:toxin HigB-1